MKTPLPEPLLLAVADVLHDERAARTAADRELKADLARARERIDEYGNVIETRFLGLEHRMRDLVGELVGAIEVKDGEPGPAGDRGERGETGERGDRGPDGPAGPQGEQAYVGQARGLYSVEGDYRAMDVVTFNGSEWRAMHDNPGPLPGDGWRMGAKGSKGKPGEKGERGPKGDPGVGLAHVELLDGTLVFTRTDGSALSVDLWPLFADQAAA